MHRNCRLLFEKYGPPYFKDGMRVLEVAPDGFPSTFRRAVASKDLTWDGLDVDQFVGGEYGSKLTYRAKDPYAYPIPDATYDAVVAANVLEHIPRPWVWVREVARVCRPGGLVITVNPTNYIHHPAPEWPDCWRVFPDGMRALYAEAGLETVLSTFEAVEPWYVPVLRTARQLARIATFRRPSFIMGPLYDTITVGRKPA